MPLSPYIKPPEPDDDAEILPGWTWGEHRQMLSWLDELEAEDPIVKASREALDKKLEEAGFDLHNEPELICRHCRRPVSRGHDEECPEHVDPKDFVKREAGGYQYLTDKFEVVHTTSVPMTDDEALEYFGVVQLMFHEDIELKYIMRREVDGLEFKMMPWTFNKESWEVYEIVRPST